MIRSIGVRPAFLIRPSDTRFEGRLRVSPSAMTSMIPGPGRGPESRIVLIFGTGPFTENILTCALGAQLEAGRADLPPALTLAHFKLHGARHRVYLGVIVFVHARL